jgi:uncharacterized protein (TIGR02147 family)
MESPQFSIFEYLDYREFLKDFYRDRKKRHFYFSLRYIAQKPDCDAAHVARVISGKRHLSEKSLSRFARLCGFNDEEKAYFEALFQFNTARSEKQSKIAFEALLSLGGVQSRTLLPQHYEYYSKWYYTAVRALVAVHPFRVKGDFKKIASALNPPISTVAARESVALLLKLGLIQEDKEGISRPDRHGDLTQSSNTRPRRFALPVKPSAVIPGRYGTFRP